MKTIRELIALPFIAIGIAVLCAGGALVLIAEFITKGPR